MKRILSIFLVGLLIYNMMGFSVVYWVEENFATNLDASQPVASTLSQDYVLVKIPLSLPYQTDWSASKKVSGKLRVGDMHYQMVSQQLINDTLYTVCKVDQSARDRFFNLASHINQHVNADASTDVPSKKSSLLLKDFVKEYLAAHKKHLIYVFEWLLPRKTSTQKDYVTLVRALDILSPPPQSSLFLLNC